MSSPHAFELRGILRDLRHDSLVTGILNVTPDSFSDGGRYLDVEHAVARGVALAAEGAEVIDVGGESTRPGSDPVPLAVELARVVPVVAALRGRIDAAISVDTTKAEVARAALDAGADLVNDISALRWDAAMGPLVAERDCAVVLMHALDHPKTMQRDPRYADVTADIYAFFVERLAACDALGIARKRVVLDVGLGFGKTVEHNLALLARLDAFLDLGCPLLVGASRKSFLGKLLGGEATPVPTEERLWATLAVQAAAHARGARIFRVHDARAACDVARVTAALSRVRADAPPEGGMGERRGS